MEVGANDGAKDGCDEGVSVTMISWRLLIKTPIPAERPIITTLITVSTMYTQFGLHEFVCNHSRFSPLGSFKLDPLRGMAVPISTSLVSFSRNSSSHSSASSSKTPRSDDGCILNHSKYIFGTYSTPYQMSFVVMVDCGIEPQARAPRGCIVT